MLHLLLSAAIAAPIVAYLVPSLTTSRHPAGGTPTNRPAPSRPHGQRGACSPEQLREWAVHEFAFGRAIEEYEELIDRTAERLP